MAWEFSNSAPIYLQIVERVRLEIIGGRILPGERLQSVRDFALTASVNPNTVQRAYAELEADGLVVTQRGDGRFVTEDTRLIAEKRNLEAQRLVADFSEKLALIGVSGQEAGRLAALAAENAAAAAKNREKEME